MPKPTSKRQRKQKNRNSLRQKQTAASDTTRHGAPPINAQPSGAVLDDAAATIPVDAEDLQPLQEDNSNALILPASRKRSAPDAATDPDDAPSSTGPLTKAQKRKLRRIAEEKAARAQRAHALAMIQSHALDAQAAGLMQRTAKRGQRSTVKESLKRDLALQRAGLPLPRGSRLLRQRTVGGEGDGMGEEDGMGSEEEEEQELAAHRYTTNPSQQNDDYENDDDENDDEHDKIDDKNKDKSLARTATTSTHHHVDEVDEVEETPQERHARHRAMAEATKQHLRQHGLLQDDDDDTHTHTHTHTHNPTDTPHPTHPIRVVHFARPDTIQAVRTNLPIHGMEQEIMEAIHTSDVVLLAGATGCGKTTQVPQFLLEAGYGCPEYVERTGMVGVTQPRRVAAISTARRVGEELGEVGMRGLVGYQVRYDAKVGPDARVKFMTDGILLRELQGDFLLSRYSCLLIDEAHERSLNTDLLIGLLSRVVPMRRTLYTQWASSPASSRPPSPQAWPLKLIIMSATLKTDDFLLNPRLFKTPPPLMEVPARQFPVTVHFSRKTELVDYVGAAYKKVCSIHRKLPPGGILVFLTGQREVCSLVQRLQQTFNQQRTRRGQRNGSQHDGQQQEENTQDQQHKEEGMVLFGADAADAADSGGEGGDDVMMGGDGVMGGVRGKGRKGHAQHAGDEEDDMMFDDASMMSDEELLQSGSDEDEVVILGGEGMSEEEIQAAEAAFETQLIAASAPPQTNTTSTIAAHQDKPPTHTQEEKGGGTRQQEQEGGTMPVHVLPLYAMLPPTQQAHVFAPPPAGARLIVVATNVAETSLTIPGIRYVVDTGRSKQKLQMSDNGAVTRFHIDWISKASALQRAGRAGRTGPGHCYRLFSSAHYNDTFAEHTAPEIVNTPLEQVALSLKSMGVDKVANFPFPTPPPADALTAALDCLRMLGALQYTGQRKNEHGQRMGEPSSGGVDHDVGGLLALTPLGGRMARLPLSPRHARMLLQVVSDIPTTTTTTNNNNNNTQAHPWAVALAAVMSVESPLMHDQPGASESQRQRAQHAQRALQHPDGEPLTVVGVLAWYESAVNKAQFCRMYGIHPRLIAEISSLYHQLTSLLHTLLPPLPRDPAHPNTPRYTLLPPGTTPIGGQHKGVVQLHTPHTTQHTKDHNAPHNIQKNTPKNTPHTAAQHTAAQHAVQGTHLPVMLPPPAVSHVLRRAMVAGWVDRVARRVKPEHLLLRNAEDNAQGVHVKRRAVRYQCAFVQQQTVYLHPTSPLAAVAPEYVVFTEVLQTDKRAYMRGVCTIDPAWIYQVAPTLCTLSPPLDTPPPVYDPERDVVLAHRGVTFGPPSWALPPLQAPLPPNPPPTVPAPTAVFAAALLGGAVGGAVWGALRGMLATPPESLLSASGLAQARCVELLHALDVHQVSSRKRLVGVWKQNPLFLQREVLLWVQRGGRDGVAARWVKMVAEVMEIEEREEGGGGGGGRGKKKKKKKRERMGV